LSTHVFCKAAVAYLKPDRPRCDERVALAELDYPVARDLKNGLLAMYVVDEGDSFTFVQKRHLAEASMPTDELHDSAMHNLATLASGNLEVRRHSRIWAVMFDGNFDASLMLLDELWETTLAGYVSGSFAVAIPARDVLAFCDADSAQGCAELRTLIRHARSAGDHLISDRIFLRDRDGWRGASDA
jgi:hypothetical protein